MIDKVPYWRPPPAGRVSDLPADVYERVHRDYYFWGNGYYNPDYEYGTFEENCKREIPLPWPMTADDVALYRQMSKELMLIEAALYPVGKRPDLILQTSKGELIPEGRERDGIEREFRVTRRTLARRVCAIHGYEEYRWPGEFGLRLFIDPHRRNKLALEFFPA